MDQKVVKEKIEELLKKENKKGKFKQTVEMAITFQSVDLEGKDKLNLVIQLPKGRGKDVEIGVFADGDLNLKAKKFSKYVLSRPELETYAKSKRNMRKFATDCYWFLAQPDLLPLIGKFWGVVLGTRGKMPQPLPPNIDPTALMQKYKNSIRIKSKKSMVIHAPIGVEDMPADSLAENFSAVLTSIERQITEDKISSIHIKKTMGESVRVM